LFFASSANQDFDDPFFHSRDLFVLLLSGLPQTAGVFSGLDSKNEESPDDPPADERGGFLIAVVSG